MEFYTASPELTGSCARVLMLHGHGQSGQFFFHKTRFMQEALEQTILGCLRDSHRGQKSLETVEFFYPSGPLRANPDDGSWEGSSLRAWGYGDPDKDQIYGLGESMQMISRILEEDGPFIGIVGFSAGAAIAALVISLLEKNKSGFNFMSGHAPLKFAICFSGFRFENPVYAPIYESKLKTPILNVVGTMDSMIEPAKSFRLQDCGENIELHKFSGTHYVPRSREFLEKLRGFLWKSLTDLSEVSDEDDQWEDC